MGKARKWDTQETAFVEIEVKFRRHGYYLPKKVDCDPDDGHDEEGEDNRDITEILIDGKKVDLRELARLSVNFVRKYAVQSDNYLQDCLIDLMEEQLFHPSVDAWEE